MDFRDITKEMLAGRVPTDIVDEIRGRAAKERRSLSEVMTEVYCRGLGMDPSVYGIHPGGRRRERRPTARAS